MVAKWWEVRFIYVIIKLSSLFMNKHYSLALNLLY